MLQNALRDVVGQDLIITAAGRTDSGVHARGQVVSFEMATKLSLRQLTLAISTKIDKDITVYRIDKLPKGFNARNQSIGKQYVYQIYQGLVKNNFLADYSWHIKVPLDIDAMQKAASFLVGEHDYSSFRSKYCTSAHARRYIWYLNVTKENQLIKIDIRGNAFCHNMVRIIVGTLAKVGLRKISPDDVKNILDKKDRKFAGVTAKPYGLFFNQVYYPDSLQDALIPEGAIFPRYPITKESWPFTDKDIEYGPT